MKRLFCVLILLHGIFLLSSCAKNNSDTYFIHACAFEKNGDIYTVYAVSEKHGEKDSEYKLISESGKSIDKATKKLKREYADCYFATSEIYFISDNSYNILHEIAKEICASNTYPSKSAVIFIEENAKDFLSKIKSEDDMKHILKLTRKKSTNAVKLFSRHLGGKAVMLPSMKSSGTRKYSYAGEKELKPAKE